MGLVLSDRGRRQRYTQSEHMNEKRPRHRWKRISNEPKECCGLDELLVPEKSHILLTS
jgi:hypothetical protein